MTTATETTFRIQDILRFISSKLEIPVVALLILLIAATLLLAGWIVAEIFTERRHLKVKLPKLLDDIRAGERPLTEIIGTSGLLSGQKAALLELTRHPAFTGAMLESLGVRLVEEQQAKYDRIVKYSEMVVRLGPMLGLLGTLIPLGPGIIAMGQGDTFTLSTSLLTAFDTTIAGLAAASIATVVSAVRRSWYKNYMSVFETAAECVAEAVKKNASAIQ
jgi:biopolymer transport protein ExbB/TolQ